MASVKVMIQPQAVGRFAIHLGVGIVALGTGFNLIGLSPSHDQMTAATMAFPRHSGLAPSAALCNL